MVEKSTNDNLARLVALLPGLSSDQLRLLVLFAEFLMTQQKKSGG